MSYHNPISAILFFNEYKIILYFHLTAILLSSLLWYGQQFINIIVYEKCFLKIILESLKFHWKCYFKLISVVFLKSPVENADWNLYMQVIWKIFARKADWVLKHSNSDTWEWADTQGDFEQSELEIFP